MEYNISIRNSIFPNLSGLWISCSTDTKNAINSFFVDNMHYEKVLVPIIYHGSHPFSYYKYSNGTRDIFMVTISRTGIRQILQICKEVKTEKEISAKIKSYFYSCLKESEPETVSNIKRVLPLIVNHYIEYKDNSLYDIDSLVGRYLCFIYPLDHKLIKGVNAILQKISFDKKDTIMKSQICI